jgi:molybdate transport system substrate-binding protein
VVAHIAAELAAAGLSLTSPSYADEALVAAAANFKTVLERLEEDFEREFDHTLTVTSGSTGALYVQIVNGAPYDVFVAADQRRPALLEQQERAVAGSRFTYALGRLALWSPDPAFIAKDGAETLRAGRFRRLAMANPDLAPYGAAAMDVLRALNLQEALGPKIVTGQNIGQAFALVSSGNTELGFVSLSYILSPQNEQAGSRWDAPSDLYAPIRQDAVLLKRAQDNEAAIAFLDYLKSERARKIIADFGYGLE